MELISPSSVWKKENLSRYSCSADLPSTTQYGQNEGGGQEDQYGPLCKNQTDHQRWKWAPSHSCPPWAPSSTVLSKEVSGLVSPSPQCSLPVLLAPTLNASRGTILRGDCKCRG
ncbi:Hypothetical predicted protein [Marmota monax]|uniref:Uncharacterized protein n=1 Tax=Marmota monax TaxID=9995 RepID=A0A5E4A8U0_MARMO|nr:Hypothetical predicted protein [Marmota monax]